MNSYFFKHQLGYVPKFYVLPSIYEILCKIYKKITVEAFLMSDKILRICI